MECQECGDTEGPFVGCWDKYPDEDDDKEIITYCAGCAVNNGYCSCCGGYYGKPESMCGNLLDENGDCPTCAQGIKDAKFEDCGEHAEP